MYIGAVFFPLICCVAWGADSNDTPTVFVQEQFKFTVNEDNPVSTIVGQIQTWTPVSRLTLFGNEAFAIDAVSGNIRTTRLLDYEERQSYTLVVEAVTLESKTSLANVIISVLDINESPSFLQLNNDVMVSSDFPVGGQVITVSAVDQDGGPAGSLQYSIQPPSSYFSINPVSGNVFARQSLSPGVITLSIVAVDMGSPRLSAKTSLMIRVIEDGVPTIPDSTPPCANVSIDITVPENVPSGTIIAQLNSKLPSENNYLINGASGLFSLSTDSNLAVNGHLDFETKKFYDLRVVREDNQQEVLLNARITIIDVNDFPPMFFGLLSPVRVPSNFPLGKTVYGVVAWDGDQPNTQNSEVSYSLVGTSDIFSINTTSGEITLKKMLEAPRTYSLRIMASDEGTPSLQGFTDIEINAFNPALGFPVFESAFVSVSLEEQQPIGTLVYTVSAINPRAGTLVYSIIGVTAQTTFFINSSTGVITTQVIFNRDSSERTALVVRATNQDDNAFNNDMLIYVEITDVNNHPPVFPFGCNSASISNDVLPGTIVFRPLATDIDISSSLTYSITDGNPDEVFEISDGETIRVKKTLSNLGSNIFNLTVNVSDSIHSDAAQLIVYAV